MKLTRNTVPDSADSFIHVVVGVIKRGQHVLTARREFLPPIKAAWEFPGGKRENGEDAADALRRELSEEAGVDVECGLPIICVRYDYGDYQVMLDAYEAHVTRGNIQAQEGQFFRWYPTDKFEPADFPPANRGLLTALQLPCTYAITPFHADNDLNDVTKLLQSRVQLIALRGRRFCDNYEYTGQAVQKIHEQGAKCMLHDRPEWVEPLSADGVHCSQATFRHIKKRLVSDSVYFAVSCHSLEEVQSAEALGADFCVLGPVAETPEHPRTDILGMDGFRQIVAEANIPVFALGGMSLPQINEVRLHGGQGIAGIRCFMQGLPLGCQSALVRNPTK